MPSGRETAFDAVREGVPEVEADRRTALQLVLVIAHHDATVVSRKMVEGIAVADRERGIGAPVRVKTHSTA